ncbi:hypothetical protein R1sor_022873 [Riccia sorocarpa]|uniref:t-SNARE coiled-coil homology domain-containing protein n=1 Tax=Riccia sorocarpa TaxID=122646 RepID=A0ABD3GN59_9MARC
MTSVLGHRGGHDARSSVSNPFDSDDDEAPKVHASKNRGGKNSGAYNNPFEDDGPASNPFDDDVPVVKHKSRAAKSSYSSSSTASNPFDDDEVVSKPKSRSESVLDEGSLFDDDDRGAKPTRESSRGFTAKLKAGGGRIAETSAKIGASASSALSSVKMPTFSSHSEGESRRGKSRGLDANKKELIGEPVPSIAPSQQDYFTPTQQSRFADQSVEELEQYAINRSQDTTSSIKNALRIAEDTVGVATKTMETLNEQGQQIRRVHGTAVTVEQELGRGEKLLGSLGGMFTKTWKPKKGHKLTGPETDPEPYRRRGNHSGESDRAGLGLAGNHGRNDGRSHSDFSGMSGAQAQLEMERQKQDDALDDLSGVLGQLKNMALDMGNEVQKQNQSLDVFGEDVNEVNNRVKGANQRARRLIHR